MPILRVLDSDFDTRYCNGDNQWEDLDAALWAIREGIKENGDEVEYFPWYVVDWASATCSVDMERLATIEGVHVDVSLDYVTADGKSVIRDGVTCTVGEPTATCTVPSPPTPSGRIDGGKAPKRVK